MRPTQQKQRSRGRGNGSGNNINASGGSRGKGQNPLTRTYDSSGPDVKIRGTAQHIAEKYTTLARDAQSMGDRVMAENYLQHAEHYNRLIAAAQAMFQERFVREERGEYSERENVMDSEDSDNQDMEEGFVAPQQSYSESRPETRQEPRQDRQETRHERQSPEPRSHEQRQPREPRQNVEPHAPPQEPRQYAQRQSREQPPRLGEPMMDGSGPQPMIEGTPVEVAIEEAATSSQNRGPSSRHRGAGRPRRPPHRADIAEEGANDSEVSDVGVTSEIAE